MNKRAVLFFFCLLLAACHCGKTSAPFPDQKPVFPPHATAARDVKTIVAPGQRLTAPPPAEKTAPGRTPPQTAPNTYPNAVPSVSSGQYVQGNPYAEENSAGATVLSAYGTAAVSARDTKEEKTPSASVPVDSPAGDKAVFEDEKLIDLQDRMLHPYAALAPDENAVQTAPWAYEQLKYGVYYTFIKAGTAYIRNRGLVSVGGRPAYLLQTTAFSAPVIDAFFKVRDINQSWLDAQHFYSLGYGQSVREGGYRRDEWITFDYPNQKYAGQIQKKEAPRAIGGPLDTWVLDMLTALYYVRTRELTPGQDIVFDIINREKQYPLLVKVLKREKVKTDAGVFDCVLVEPQLRGEGIFVSKGKSLKVWLTDDKYKMPVKMKVEVFIGSVSAQLLEYRRQEQANIL